MTDQDPEAWAREFGDFLEKNKPPAMIRQKLRSQDSFWNQKAQEEEIVRNLDTEIGNLKSALELADKVRMVQHSPGWDHFVKAVEDCRSYRRQEMELSSGTDTEMRILQGRVRELGAILGLMNKNQSNTKALSSRLEVLKLERQTYVREDGKVQPKGAA